MTRRAVVLFNLGGPDRLEAVRPFLFNLFNDPAIIGLPQPLRYLLAQLLSARRTPTAMDIYEKIGGGSPLLANTRAQAEALQALLGGDTRVFIAMRYWHPMAQETAAAVKAFGAEQVILLPLYPQFSTTTTASSHRDWMRAARDVGLEMPTSTVCCYPTARGFVAALAELIRPSLAEARKAGRPRILFSAHGLPKKIVRGGDPYQWQVEQTAAAVMQELGATDLDWLVCYQSRVGPLEWISPYTDAEIDRAGRDRVPVVLVPVSFVSEHSETLVELDIEYRERAEHNGVPLYMRVPTVAAHAAFIAHLADLVRMASATPSGTRRADGGGRLCPSTWVRCFATP
ncbi:MAG TPA: ferrochelatase [Alphaproteobacteria bacterium]|nr:ferrochelatase [Alphaproteobacteria bacterium]